MKKIFSILVIALGAHAASSAAFDLGKILQVPEENKQQKTEQAAQQPASQSSNISPLMLLGKTPVEDEVRIGRQVAGDLLGAAPLVKDDTLQRYVNSVGRWVAQQSNRKDLNWHFGVIESEDINAFAAPGGYIFITKGLLLNMQSEAELAGTLAHETVHVLRKHHLNAVQKGARMNLATLAAGEAVKNDQRRAQMEKITGGFKELYSRGLDKEDEFEADRMGIVIAARAGYDPYGLPAVLQTLGAMNPQDGALAFMFKTHPAPAKRLERLSPLLDRLDRYAGQPQVLERFKAQLAAIKK